MKDLNSLLDQAAEAVRDADALLLTAGASMGVDSGLPDFRGTEGFWRAYPVVAKLGLSFPELANPMWFDKSPGLAWASYGHRLNLYRQTSPHAGFGQLLKLARAKPGGYFVFTSNVDGHFQIELGAGTAVPTVRSTSESIAETQGARLIRLNPREDEVPAGHLGIPLAAAEGIRQWVGRLRFL